MGALVCLLTLVLFLCPGPWQFGVLECILVAAAAAAAASQMRCQARHLSSAVQKPYESVSQSSRIILGCLIAPPQLDPTLKRRPLCLCVLAGGLSEDPSHLGTGGRVTSPPLPAPSLPPHLHASDQSAPAEIRSRENPPRSWLPWQRALVQAASCCGEKRGGGGGEGGRRGKKETRKREGGK